MAITDLTDQDRRVARNIKLAMQARGFTQRGLADEMRRRGLTCGRTGKTVDNWINQVIREKRTLSIGEFHTLAEVLGVPPRPLMGEPEHVLRYISEHPDTLLSHLREHGSVWIPMFADERAFPNAS